VQPPDLSELACDGDSVVLLVAACVAAWWWHADVARWLPVTVAVLVVTCPCALSLATPTALTAAAGTLTGLGLVPSRGLALETLARVDHVVFDKTGTLTAGCYRVLETRVLSGGAQAPLLRVAVSLERHSEHPIARAIEALVQGPVATAEEVLAEAGCGVSARVAEQRWWLGSPGGAAMVAGIAAMGV
jgi:Cu2+-exporting ATPase